MSLAEVSALLTSQLQRSHALLTSSGSAALIVALRAAGVKPGAEVLMPAICCPAVLFAIQLAGYKCVLADVDIGTLNSGVGDFEQALTVDTRAIVAVHGFGKPCEIVALSEYTGSKGLVLIEDACLALGGSFQGQPLGSFGDISIVSFGYDKPVTCDYGGALLCNDDDVATRASRLIAENEFFAYRANMTSQQRLHDGLANLPIAVSERLANVRLVDDELTSDRLVKPAGGSGIAYWRYPLLFEGDRDMLVASAAASGRLFTTHYKSLAELMTGVQRPNAKYVSDRILNVFVRPGTPRQQIKDRVAFLNGYQQ